MISYDIYGHGRMMRDTVRTEAYAQALQRSVRKDSVILDVGTGVGIWALLACRFGARKVYAVEPHSVIQLAREVAVANGYSDRIEFIQDLSTNVKLAEQADVLVTEMHGVVPMVGQNLLSIIDARRRLLKPGGSIIPKAETLWATPIEASESYDQVKLPWANRPHGFEWGPALRFAANDWFKIKGKLEPSDYFAEPKSWATIDYHTLQSPNVLGELTWTAKRDGTAHGVAVWFDSLLVDGVSFSNAPGLPRTIFGQAFFPWPEPVMIATGDTISVELRCDLVRSDYLWGWKTTVLQNGDTAQVKSAFRQSSFFGTSLSSSGLHKRAPDHVPELGPRGKIQAFILSRMNGKNSIKHIAAETADRFPQTFADCSGGPLSAVADLSEKYAK
jgi:protein arginine N-methyltransferase 1